MRRRILTLLALLAVATGVRAEDGYDLWLRYQPLADERALEAGRASFRDIVVQGTSPTIEAARAELRRGLGGLLERDPVVAQTVSRDGAILAGTPRESTALAELRFGEDLGRVGEEGFVIRSMTI